MLHFKVKFDLEEGCLMVQLRMANGASVDSIIQAGPSANGGALGSLAPPDELAVSVTTPDI